MSNENTSLRVYLTADEYKDIQALAEEKHISLSAAAKLAIDFYRENKDAEMNTAALMNQLTNYLDSYLVKQKQMMESGLKYFRSGINGMNEYNLMYSHVLNSILWKLNCTERDFQDQTKNQNPVISRSVECATTQMKALRQKRMSADKKYQDKAVNDGTK